MKKKYLNCIFIFIMVNHPNLFHPAQPSEPKANTLKKIIDEINEICWQICQNPDSTDDQLEEGVEMNMIICEMLKDANKVQHLFQNSDFNLKIRAIMTNYYQIIKAILRTCEIDNYQMIHRSTVNLLQENNISLEEIDYGTGLI